MRSADRNLADRARGLLRARGGRASSAELLAALFGPTVDPDRWDGLLQVVLAPVPDIRRLADGTWALVSSETNLSCRLDELSFVALATASTSADPWRARLAALAGVRVQAGRALAGFEAILNPRSRLPRYLLQASGLTQAEADEAPSFADVVDDLLDFLSGDVLVGVDIRAQVEILSHELSRLDRPGLEHPLLDLGDLAARVGITGKPSLPSLAAAVGLTHPRPYQSASDARVAARLACRLLELASGRGLGSSEVLCTSSERFWPGALQRPEPPQAPDGPGVYLLKDAGGEVLYVGKAKSLRRRLGSYHHRPLGLLRRLEGLAEAVTDVETISVRSELEALILEARLLRRHRPPFNTQQRAVRGRLFLRADLDEGRATLTSCRQPALDGALYLGPLRTARGTAAALRLVRQLFPELQGRTRAQAATRHPSLQAALRFLADQKDEVLDRLRAEQRVLAADGERITLDASRELLRRAVEFSLDTATSGTAGLEDRLLVLSPGGDGPLVAHFVQHGRLLACVEAEDEATAREQVLSIAESQPTGTEANDERADEPSIIFRWLCGLGPEHKVLRIGDVRSWEQVALLPGYADLTRRCPDAPDQGASLSPNGLKQLRDDERVAFEAWHPIRIVGHRE